MATKFVEINRVKLEDNDDKTSRYLVISKNLENNTYTIAQQIVFDNNGLNMGLFLKGGIHINTKEDIQKIIDMLENALTITNNYIV